MRPDWLRQFSFGLIRNILTSLKCIFSARLKPVYTKMTYLLKPDLSLGIGINNNNNNIYIKFKTDLDKILFYANVQHWLSIYFVCVN